MDRLLRTFEFDGNALEILALDEGALGGVGVDAETILLVFLASLVDVAFLRLLCLELFLDRSLITFTMLGLTSDERGGGVFELVADLLSELQMEGGLLVRLLAESVERVSKLASRGGSVRRGGGGPKVDGRTYPISSLPKVTLVSLARRFAYSSSMAALKEERESDARNDNALGSDTPLLPKITELFHGPCGTAHSSEQHVDAGITGAPKGIAIVKRASSRIG